MNGYTLNIVALPSSERTVNIYQNTEHHIPEGHNLQSKRSSNLILSSWSFTKGVPISLPKFCTHSFSQESQSHVQPVLFRKPIKTARFQIMQFLNLCNLKHSQQLSTLESSGEASHVTVGKKAQMFRILILPASPRTVLSIQSSVVPE